MRRISDDRGLTLVELLVYILIATIVGTIVAGILINSLRVQAQVQDASASAQGSFLVADAMTSAARNSSAMGATTLPDGTVLVRTRSLDPSEESTTTMGPDNWICYAFAYGDGQVRFRTSDVAIPDPDAAALSTWTLIADDVEPIDGSTPVLSVFNDGGSLRIALITNSGDGGPQQLTTVATSLQRVDPSEPGRVSSPCF